MSMYRDSDGNRYWFDEAPDPELVRADLVEMTEEQATEAEAAAEEAAQGEE